MDWVRLGNSKGKILNGIGGTSCDVTVEELAKHNKLDDAWMAIRGERHAKNLRIHSHQKLS